jgi:uncharacterized membrane protein
MSTLVTRPKRPLRLWFVLMVVVPWAAINLYWVRTGELRQPLWFVLINLLIGFFAFGAPAIDHRAERKAAEENEAKE